MSEPKKEDTKPTRKSRSDETLLQNVVLKYFKYAGAALGVWLMGYTNFSPSWVLLGLVVYVWKERHVKRKKIEIEIQQQTARDEKTAILARVEDLPSWVHFPDVERAEWFNKILDQIWPYIGGYVQDLLQNSIQGKIQSSHSSVASFKFTKIDLGDIPPRIGGVKVYTEHVRRDEIYMDVDIIYSSDCEIGVKIKGIPAGIKDLQVRGTMRVIFKPLLSKMPLFGGLSVFFLNNPTIDFNLTDTANAFDIPGLRDMIEGIVQEQIAGIMVLPNRIAVPMVDGVNLTLLKYPQPEGVLRIHILEGKDLISADINLVGKGKSDPFAVIKFADHKFKTKVIQNSLNPVWNQAFEAVIDCKDAQRLDIEVRDEDPGNKDDFLGNVDIDISTVSSQGLLDTWLPLKDVKKGLIHVKLVWMYLANSPAVLDKVLKQMSKDKKYDELSSCILMVNMDSAKDLPRVKKQMSEPSPYAILSMAQDKQETDEKPNTDSPIWEKPFRFLIHDPYVQTLSIEVKDKKTDKSLGQLNFPVKTLLSEPDMTLDKGFALQNSGLDSKINMRLSLRVLTTEYNPEWTESPDDLMADNSSSVDPPPSSSVDPEKETSASKDNGKKESTPPITKQSIQKDESIPQKGKLIPPADNAKQRETTDSELRQRKSQTINNGKQICNQEDSSFGRGKVQLTFRYSTQRQKLVVVIHKCVDLLPCDDDNLADPYVKLYLLPDKSSSSKRKTQVVKNNLNPVYDETFEFPVNPDELANKDLEVTVKNDTSFFSSNVKVIGMVTIDLSKLDLSKATTEWFYLRTEEEGERAVSMESDV